MSQRSRPLSTILLAGLLALFPTLGAAAENTPRFRHITLADGLPESGIYRIGQDQRGFVWLGTQNGLVRFDGVEFESFKPDPLDTRSLSGRLVMSLLVGRDDSLWVGTRSGGLNRFDPRTEIFTHYRNRQADDSSLPSDAVGAILEDRKGNIWVGSGVSERDEPEPLYLSRMQGRDGRFERLTLDREEVGPLSGNGVSELAEDVAGRIWVASRRSGLFRFDPSRDEILQVGEGRGADADLPSDYIYCMELGKDGILWIGTWGQGLVSLEVESGRITTYRSIPGDSSSLTDDRVMSIRETRDGVLWVGTRDNTLHRFDRNRRSFERLRHDPSNPFSLSDGYGSWVIFEDATGTIWVSQGGVGLDLLDPYASKFRHLRHDPDDETSLGDGVVQTLTVDQGGAVWVGTHRSLTRLDPETGIGDRIPLPAGQGDLPAAVTSLLEDKVGRLWVGTEMGLFVYDSESAVLERFASRSLRLPEGSIESLMEDRAGRLWVGIGDLGLYRLDATRNRLTSFLPSSGEGRLLDGHVKALIEDREEHVWIGTVGGGLHWMEKGKGPFRVFHSSLTGLEVVFALHEDREGRIWAGTQNGGLHLVDSEVGTRRRLTEAEGLAHDSIYGIEEDRSGRLWIATGRGLSMYDPSSGSFRNYGGSDGLLEPRLSGGTAMGPGGEIYLGSPRGLQVLLPEGLQDDPNAPPVSFTHLRIFNETIRDYGGGILNAPVSLAESIRLGPEHKVFTLEFAALHFAHPELNRYAYRLDPFDGDWIQAGRQRRATYTNLAPGEYVFRVKAANSDGVWNEEGASIRIQVDPPWWKTRWAQLLYALAVIFLLAIFTTLQRRRVLRRERERSERREARLRTEAAEALARASETEARAIRKENERKTAELEDARDLQLSMLPERLPDHPELEFAATMITATEVGGDYYDFDVFSDGTVIAALGDAAGHGLRAGMMVMNAKSLFSSVGSGAELEAVLERGNRILKRMRLRRLNMALALVRIRGNELESVSAGIPPLLLYRSRDGAIWEVGQGGLPLGSLAAQSYQGAKHDFLPGDAALLMSDGFPELMNPEGEPLGYDRVREAFREVAGRDPAEMVSSFVALAEEWSSGRAREDDMTFLVIKRR